MADDPQDSSPTTGFSGIMQRVRTALTPPARAASGTPRPGTTSTGGTQQPTMGKLLKGLLALMLSIYAWQFLILFLDAWTKNALSRTRPFGNSGLGQALNLSNILVLGGFLVIWWALRRYNILPGANTARRQTSAPTTPAVKTTFQTRAERKEANAAAREEARANKTVTGEYDDIYERMSARRRRS